MTAGRHKVFSLAIIAGGQSRRMGRDKAFVDLAGKPLIERMSSSEVPIWARRKRSL